MKNIKLFIRLDSCLKKRDPKSVNYLKMSEKIEKYSLEKLEKLIVNHWEHSNHPKEKNELLELYLMERNYKLNDNFEWTPENREKLLLLNQKLINCFEKIKEDCKDIFIAHKKHIDEKKDSLDDFYIEAKVTPHIVVPDENGVLYETENGIDMILLDSINESVVCNLNIGNEEDLDEILYLNKAQNWNIEAKFEEKFNDYFISQAIHDLYDHTHLSFSDILKINHLCVELNVARQHYVEV
jgi:hypothetical protein